MAPHANRAELNGPKFACRFASGTKMKGSVVAKKYQRNVPTLRGESRVNRTQLSKKQESDSHREVKTSKECFGLSNVQSSFACTSTVVTAFTVTYYITRVVRSAQEMCRL